MNRKHSLGIFVKYVLCLLLLTAVIPGLAARAEAEQDNESKTEERKDRKASEEAAIKAEFPYSFNDVSHNLVLIEGDSFIGKVSGSGFIAKVDGKTYLYTNQHVIMGVYGTSFKTVTGETLRPSGVELSRERDIARLPMPDREDALVISSNVAMDIPLAVFGNSEGGGVATELYGKVTGVGSDLLEVSADFVSGNSGSPVLNTEQEVIGIASYVRYSAPSKMKEGTQFEDKVRRFCYRLTNVEFVPVNWRKYNEKYGKTYLQTESMINAFIAIIQGWSEDPFDRVPTENLPDMGMNRWSAKHNSMVDRVSEVIRRNRASRSTLNKIRDEIQDSAHDLSRISYRLSIEAEKRSKDRALTGFLRDEFEGHADGLAYISHALEVAGQEIADWIENL